MYISLLPLLLSTAVLARDPGQRRPIMIFGGLMGGQNWGHAIPNPMLVPEGMVPQLMLPPGIFMNMNGGGRGGGRGGGGGGGGNGGAHHDPIMRLDESVGHQKSNELEQVGFA